MKHVIILPDLGQTTSEAKVLHWHKKVGEKVSRGEPMLEVETDKVDMDVESYAEGYLRKTLVAEGDMATALEPVAILTDTPDEDYLQDDSPAPSTAALAVGREGPKPTSVNPAPARLRRAAAAPAARQLAAKLNIDLNEVTGTGPSGLITRKDVEAFSQRPPAEGGGAAKLSRALSAMAAITVESKRHIPHFYLTREFDIEKVSQWRAGWNKKHPDANTTFNDLFVWAAAQALRKVPRMNLVVRDGSHEQRESADILLVVAGEEGLFLAPVADPCDLSWLEYLQRMRQAVRSASAAAGKASQGGLRPALAVSNLGMHQVDRFAAIIPPGCSAVLAIGSVAPAPVVEQGKVVVRQRCTVTVSADHRVVDGVTAAKFMEQIQRHLANHGSDEPDARV